MPHENEPPASTVAPNLEIVEPKEGAAHAYANFLHLSWNGMDLTVELYQIEQPNREIPGYKDSPNRLRHTASVTLTWAAAKSFHRLLGQVLERYEKAYGPINTEFKDI